MLILKLKVQLVMIWLNRKNYLIKYIYVNN